MAANYIQPGDTLTQIAPAGGTVSGGIYVFGATAMVALQKKAAGEEVECTVTGVYEVGKTAALVVGSGDKLYFDVATKLVNKTDTGVKIGFAARAELAASTTVRVRLTP